MDVPVFTVHLPQYHIETEPDHAAIGKVVDAEIRRHFMGRTVLARGLCVKDHSGRTIDELVEIIKQHGTDRYDPNRKGIQYENVQNKRIDIFAFRSKVTKRMRLFMGLSYGFYHYKPGRVDILIIYDATKLKAVLHRYEGRTDTKRDGFVFKDPARKQEALLGIVKIL